MIGWTVLAVIVAMALVLERRRSAEFWAKALQFHEARVKVWQAAVEAPSSATIASARQQALGAALQGLRAGYPTECVAGGLMHPQVDRELETVLQVSSSGRWDAEQAGRLVVGARRDAAHATAMQGGHIEWGQMARYGWGGALLFAAAGAGVAAVVQAAVFSMAAGSAVLGFVVVGVERDRFWTWFGDTLKSTVEAGAATLWP